MKRILMTMALACALSAPALAGDVPSVDFVPPPPGGAQNATTTGPGEIPTVGIASSIIEIVIDLLT